MFSSRDKAEVKLYFDSSNEENLKILEQCPSLYQEYNAKVTDNDRINNIEGSEPTIRNGVTYYPPYYLYNSHVMNYYGSFKIPKLNLPIRRESLINPADNGTISLDWFELGEFKEDTPTIVICHGLTGGSHERYIQYFARKAYKEKGFRCVVFNYRGCAGNKVTAEKLYSAVQLDDIKYITEYVQQQLPSVKKWFLVGFSLGSAILVNYLAAAGKNSPYLAHVSISNPMNMIECTKNLSSTYINNLIYNKGLANNLKRLAFKFGDRLEKYGTKEQIGACQTIMDFDNLVTSKMFGFETAEQYYLAASSSQSIDKLEKPILFINAIDDPIAPVAGFPWDKFKSNPNTILATTRWGAHLGFISYEDHLSFSDKIAVEYLSTFLKDDAQDKTE
ncbi:hypothetical protein DICPUDRAFT_55809 [Dictyostelium purpureum]|uniref:AB hydrolase-1 domain-containing protein n=1 Tax=Dictyostelium purpureum TaxID=5786 RepID=F0ZNL3_DICPU|nr:uncharacterized protein DICPUDRAFT_55809 [Dictyostelium purpureum]EGC34463.1 hypothetical protein DICPUDRAFT_55809 [Dictyostelium purpureum]|eukprot:XP_003288998.1 hypothetical protein DICPUDRAFT_55809 [Dictyostelium purpureum]